MESFMDTYSVAPMELSKWVDVQGGNELHRGFGCVDQS